MKNKERERLDDLSGVLLHLIETSEDKDETEFLHEMIDKINKRKGDILWFFSTMHKGTL